MSYEKHHNSAPGSDAYPLLRIETHEKSGRSYHANRDIPAATRILDVDTPYAYTIWKPFRNEVCAECWRYDCGRRSFLTRRDDEGAPEADAMEAPLAPQTQSRQDKSAAGAGLWFCDSTCQGSWLQREGFETLSLLRVLEQARRQKEIEKDRGGGFRLEALGNAGLTEEKINRAWEMIAQKEQMPKEVRRWGDLQLDHFEADVARYVLIALVHRYHGARRPRRIGPGEDQMNLSQASSGLHGILEENHLQHGGADWNDFASLQSNEVDYLKTYPELLENQIRVYQVLKGRFGGSTMTSVAASEGRRESLAAPDGDGDSRHNHRELLIGQSENDGLDGFGGMIKIDNVRRAFSVDPGNSFGIWETPLTDESELVGFAVYPTPSFFNHHCSPNVAKERSGRALRFVTTRAVKAGEELCISYGRVERMKLEERQKELRDGWFFECRCSRCVADYGSNEQ